MKDFKKSCRTLGTAQKGNSNVIILAVVAVAAAGVLGFVAGNNSGSVSLTDIKQPTAQEIQAAENETSAKPNPVVAKVNGTEIKQQEIVALLNSMPAQVRQNSGAQLYPMALEQAISNKLADSKAALSFLDKDPEVQKQLWQAREQIIRNNFVERAVNARISEDKLKAEYENYIENFPEIEEVKSAHILVDDEKTAKEIIKKLDGGADFAELAKENSKDGSAERGGELGYFAENEVVPEFAEAAFSAQVGTYVKNPVKSDFGYHVVRVDEKRMRPPAAFESVKPFIQQELQRKELQAMLEEWKSEADIERFDFNGNPITSDDNAVTAQTDGEPQAAEPAAGDEAEPAAQE